MQFAYKAFYRVFDYFSYISIPHDAGDFSLMDKRVVQAILQFPERDLFLRGVRAFAGFRQTGVDYVRPERMFGRSTNNLLKNIGWAKKGILSFSNTPLNMISFAGSFAAGRRALFWGSFKSAASCFSPTWCPRASRRRCCSSCSSAPSTSSASACSASTWPRSSRRSSAGLISSAGA